MSESVPDSLLDALADALAGPGWLVLDDALPAALAGALAQECRDGGGEAFRAAGIGRAEAHRMSGAVRSDHIRWLQGDTPATRGYLDWMEAVRLGLNRRLFLGLFDYESHFARYVPGAFYRRHRDAFGGGRNRVLSTVLYLNPQWPAEAGGELVLYGAGEDEVLAQVRPEFNRHVVFLSETFPHEVKPATRERHSIAGWFRVKG